MTACVPALQGSLSAHPVADTGSPWGNEHESMKRIFELTSRYTKKLFLHTLSMP